MSELGGVARGWEFGGWFDGNAMDGGVFFEMAGGRQGKVLLLLPFRGLAMEIIHW